MRRFVMVLVLLGVACPCFAKARYAPKKDMILEAKVIAVVNITKVEDVQKKGNHWTYRQKATAAVEQCLKGDAKGEIEIYGMETFICAQCRYQKGRFILFLREDGDILVGSNWHLGIRPVADGKVQWFKDETTFLEMVETPFADVIEQIKTAVASEQSNTATNKTVAGDSAVVSPGPNK